MLRAVPRSFFSSCYDLIGPEGNTVAILKMSSLQEKATLSIGGQEMRIYRDGAFTGPFVLECDGEVLVEATKPSAWKNRFELRLGDHTCELENANWTGSSYVVNDGPTAIGHVEREGCLTRTARVDLPDEWPPAVQAFVLSLVLLMWRRAAAAAAS